ncbi:MAG: hypothetical protein JWO81_1600 [Alphaproteobacteria bacterium]|nr:hypothetical protein [Alphaproteobacteria bacterium]
MKTDAHSLKGHGYLISILSVFLLAYPPLKSAKADPIVLACVAAGAILSILGMALRWIADRKTQRKIDRARDEAERAPDRPAGAAAGH